MRGNTNVIADLLSRWTGSREDEVKLHQLVDAPVWVNTHIELTLLNHDI